jgi:Txe/YoeB family toxin of toxin-antitoxin system
VSTYKLVYTKQAIKDAKKADSSGLKSKIEDLLEIIEVDPHKEYPPYEKLVGSLEGVYSRPINIQFRLVNQVYKKERVVKVIRMWIHHD